MKPIPVIAVVLGLAIGYTPAQAQDAVQRIRADVVAVQGQTLQIKTTTGETLSVMLADKLRVLQETSVTLAAVKPGVFVGTTSEPQADGSLRAVLIRIFPEALRGIGEGHRPMNTPAHNTMTNATVTQVATTGPTMTNATVTAAQANTMTLTYKGGERNIQVPADVPVVQDEIATAALLVPGAHVTVTATADGTGRFTSDRITVGRDGFAPM